jgi:hypothetical protein
VLDGLGPHIFFAILVHGQMHCSKRSPPNLLLYQVLVDAVLGGAIILTVAVLGPRVECFLRANVSAKSRTLKGEQGILKSSVRTFTCLVEETARL